jgi:hypothetical protein
MMEQLPLYIPAVFVLTALLTIVMLYKAGEFSKPLILMLLLWLVLQTVLSLSGFYLNTNGIPPRLTLALMPPVALILILLLTKQGRSILDGFDGTTLTLIHVVRVPVEITLYWLFIYKAVPEVMTFEGRNFDILCGLTAPLIYYLGYVKNRLNRLVLLAWNIFCLLLLINIVATAILSAPFEFQKFGFEQPNIALLYFPFIWLPGIIVPVVLFAHVVNIRKLIRDKN